MKRITELILLIVCAATASRGSETTFMLARELLGEREYPLAAVEFRRFAMETGEPEEAAAAYLYAGYAYLQEGNTESTGEMLDRAETADASMPYSDAVALLHGERARKARDPETALYFYDLLSDASSPADCRTFALRRTAAIHLSAGDLDAARRSIEQLEHGRATAQEALDAYAAGRDKSPMVGGLLGLIPGMGYWYSGEVANGVRSLILNSLFIYGMVDTAQEDQWGAFAIITFFELTWYSGSIYGGIDAAQRHNRDRLDAAIEGIERNMAYRPDPGITVPVFRLSFEF